MPPLPKYSHNPTPIINTENSNPNTSRVMNNHPHIANNSYYSNKHGSSNIHHNDNNDINSVQYLYLIIQILLNLFNIIYLWKFNMIDIIKLIIIITIIIAFIAKKQPIIKAILNLFFLCIFLFLLVLWAKKNQFKMIIPLNEDLYTLYDIFRFIIEAQLFCYIISEYLAWTSIIYTTLFVFLYAHSLNIHPWSQLIDTHKMWSTIIFKDLSNSVGNLCLVILLRNSQCKLLSNITELNIKIQKLNHALESKSSELAQIIEFNDNFMLSISHQLRNPLNNILGNLELIIFTAFPEEYTSSRNMGHLNSSDNHTIGGYRKSSFSQNNKNIDLKNVLINNNSNKMAYHQKNNQKKDFPITINPNKPKDSQSEEEKSISNLADIGLTKQNGLCADIDIKEKLNTCLLSGEILLYSINNLLDASKIELNGIEISHTPVNTRQYFYKIWKIAYMWLELKNLHGILYISKDLPEKLSLDSYKLKQVLYNLIENSSKFTDNGYVKMIVSWIPGSKISKAQLKPTLMANDILRSKLGIKNLEIITPGNTSKNGFQSTTCHKTSETVGLQELILRNKLLNQSIITEFYSFQDSPYDMHHAKHQNTREIYPICEPRHKLVEDITFQKLNNYDYNQENGHSRSPEIKGLNNDIDECKEQSIDVRKTLPPIDFNKLDHETLYSQYDRYEFSSRSRTPKKIDKPNDSKILEFNNKLYSQVSFGMKGVHNENLNNKTNNPRVWDSIDPSGFIKEKTGYLKIEVIDSGCGMDDLAIDQAFMKYNQRRGGNNGNYAGTGEGSNKGCERDNNKGEEGNTTQKRLGAGVGLWLSKELSLKMGGDLNVYSKKGEGSTFVLHVKAEIVAMHRSGSVMSSEGFRNIIRNGSQKYDLDLQPSIMYSNNSNNTPPRRHTPAKTHPFQIVNHGYSEEIRNSQKNQYEMKMSKENQKDFIPTKKLKAMVVDDNKANQEVLKSFLEKCGVLVSDLAPDGIIAVECFKKKGKNFFDFVFMDLEMPRMDGKKASALIREHEMNQKWKPVKIIIVTGNCAKVEYEFCIDKDGPIRANYVFSKPFTFMQCKNLIDKYSKSCAEIQPKIPAKTNGIPIFKKSSLEAYAQNSITKSPRFNYEQGNNNNNKYLLIVDNDEFNSKIIYNFLTNHDIKCKRLQACHDVMELVMMEYYMIKIILIDCSISFFDGIQTAKKIKEFLQSKSAINNTHSNFTISDPNAFLNPNNMAITIFGIASIQNKNYIDEGLKAGIKKIFIKPLSFDELLRDIIREYQYNPCTSTL